MAKLQLLGWIVLVVTGLLAAGCGGEGGSAAKPTGQAAGGADFTTLPSGLKYKVLTEGTGATPAATDRVSVHYRGTFEDGREFDSSHSRGQPAQFPVNGVIKGWTEALQLMKEGAKWQLVIPHQLGYGEMGMPPVIPPRATLHFEVELLKVLR